MSSNNYLKTVCTVPEMAKILGLSRARLYQLLQEGVFPRPVRPGTKRPYYPLELQQKRIEIRQTRIGFNGQPILFNDSRRSKSGKCRTQSGDKFEELVVILRELRLSVTLNKIKKAVKTLYPEGLPEGRIEDTVIRDLFRHLRQEMHK